MPYNQQQNWWDTPVNQSTLIPSLPQNWWEMGSDTQNFGNTNTGIPDFNTNAQRSLYTSTDSQNGWMNNMLGKDGWGNLGLGAAKSLMGGYLGMKQYGLSKKIFNENKKQFDLNYNAQKQNMNTKLEDRQKARVAANPDAYESVGSYMEKNRIN